MIYLAMHSAALGVPTEGHPYNVTRDLDCKPATFLNGSGRELKFTLEGPKGQAMRNNQSWKPRYS
jgi:hypothetical protein